MNDRLPIRTVAVAGSGIVGLTAAAAFARALPTADLTIIESTPDPAALADRVPVTHPDSARLHALIGLDETRLVRSGVAFHHLGTIVTDWPRDTPSWTHAFGPYGKPAGAIPFDQLWLRASREGRARPFESYSLGAAFARAGKFAPPSPDASSLLSRFAHGFRFDPEGYRRELLGLLPHDRARVAEADIAEVEVRPDGGGIGALELSNGERIKADLYVDCTGPSGRLIARLDSDYEDWSQWLPFDHLELAHQAPAHGPTPAARLSADAAGWSCCWPLPGGDLVARQSGFPTGGSFPIVRGRRRRPWVGNVLAIGDSATALDALHGFNLTLAHAALLLALELLPDRRFHPLETGEYNRRAELVTRRVRDFLALHYRCSGRCEGAWATAAEAEPPDSLEQTLDQYGHRGRLPFHEEESIGRDSWAAALLALGNVPDNLDPQSGAVPLERALPAMERLARGIGQAVEGLPTYQEYLARRAAAK